MGNRGCGHSVRPAMRSVRGTLCSWEAAIDHSAGHDAKPNGCHKAYALSRWKKKVFIVVVCFFGMVETRLGTVLCVGGRWWQCHGYIDMLSNVTSKIGVHYRHFIKYLIDSFYVATGRIYLFNFFLLASHIDYCYNNSN